MKIIDFITKENKIRKSMLDKQFGYFKDKQGTK
jgi:hypothetical protein